MTPRIRFKGFTDAWEERKLSELMIFSNGINAAKEQYGTGRKMISVMDILTPGRMKFENILNSVSVSQDIEEKNLVNSGDLVFVRSSEVTSEVGWAKAYIDSNPALFSGFSIRGKKAASFDSVFVELALNSRGRRQIERQAGGSTRFNASQGLLSNIAINMPSEEEQSKISSMMLQLDNLIAANQRKLDLLKEQKKGYLQKMFPKNGEKVPELRFAGFADDWEERKLQEVLRERNNQQPQSMEYPLVSFTVENGVTPKTDRYEREQLVVGDKSSKKYKVTVLNDIVYNPANLKFGAISRNKYGNAVFSPIYITFLVNNDVTTPEFIEMFVTRNDFIKRALKYQQGTVYERQSVSPTDLLAMNVYLPGKSEQEKIGSFFQQLDETIALHQRKLDLLKEQKKGFLQKMFV